MEILLEGGRRVTYYNDKKAFLKGYGTDGTPFYDRSRTKKEQHEETR